MRLLPFSYVRYHIPRSFLKDGENRLVLFEEFGGNPSSVHLQTVEIGSACVNAYEGRKVVLSCQNRPISGIKFASFGNPQGQCGTFKKSDCESQVNSVSILEKVSKIFFNYFTKIIFFKAQQN